MAGTGLLALLDDISTLLDDVATMSKVAVKKTAGVIGDDLAVGAEQVNGLDPKRELPIIGKVAMGSLINKAWLIPTALTLSAVAPWSITPLLMAGGAFLCFEGVEKIIHAKDKDEDHHKALTTAALKSEEALMEFEKGKIKEAVRTDAILSAEIIVISLGTMAAAPFVAKAATLVAIGIGMTVFVYGLVAGIVKMDDIGLHLTKKEGDGAFKKLQRGLGKGLVNGAAPLLKTLSVVGTAAMFLVGGSILLHGIPGGEALLKGAGAALSANPMVQGAAVILGEAMVGIAAGAATVAGVKIGAKPFAALTAKVKSKLPAIFKKKPDAVAAEASPVPTPALTADNDASGAALASRTVRNTHNSAAAQTVAQPEAASASDIKEAADFVAQINKLTPKG